MRQISGVSGLLKRSSPSRIVIVASLAHRLGKLDLDDLNFEKSFGGDKVYCSSKLANILMSNELARKLKGTGTLFKEKPPETCRALTAIKNIV
jgi:NAD(P)-dependent dehydrogenase (short-subunit alcohol dehydrogenase family)